MKKHITALLVFIWFTASLVMAADESVISEESALLNEMKLIGRADLSVLWWDVYNAELYNRDGIYQGLVSSLVLKLNYQQNISRQDLIEATEKEFKRQKPVLTDEQRGAAIKAFENYWPDIAKGDSLTFFLRDGGGVFYHNGKTIGEVDSEVIARAFLNIWLSEESSYPELSVQLRGVE